MENISYKCYELAHLFHNLFYHFSPFASTPSHLYSPSSPLHLLSKSLIHFPTAPFPLPPPTMALANKKILPRVTHFRNRHKLEPATTSQGTSLQVFETYLLA